MIRFNEDLQRYELVQTSKSECSFCGIPLTPLNDYKISMVLTTPKEREVNNAYFVDQDGVAHDDEAYWRIEKSTRTVKNQHFCKECWEHQLKKRKSRWTRE